MKCQLRKNEFDCWEVDHSLTLPINLIAQIESFNNIPQRFLTLTNKQFACIGDFLVLESGTLRVYTKQKFFERYRTLAEASSHD